MKRLLLLLMLFVLACPLAHAEMTAQYKALTNVDFGLRKKPEESSYRYLMIPEKSKVKILEWGEEWCLIDYQGQAGYAKTKWLYHVQSLDALHYPLPNMVHNITGYVVFNQNLLLAGGGFNGLTTEPGQIACVDAEQQPGFYSIPIWREQEIVTGDLVTYHPFTDWREASSGDIIGGFTTFYGDQQGKGKAENREHNIILAYLMYTKYSGDDLTFDAAVLKPMLERAALIGKRLYENEPRVGFDGENAGQALFYTSYGPSWPASDADIIFLRISDDQPKIISCCLLMTAISVNTSQPELCIELLEDPLLF